MAYSYDKDTDYQALIDQAVASGDMASAALYEQQRNTKINDLNAAGTNSYGATATNNYSQYLNTAPDNYVGSATGVGVHTTDQAAIRDQMNQNSMQWWGADDATKAQLEAANQKLAAQLGSGVTFDSTTGTWSGTADEYEILRPSFNYDDYLATNAKPTYESQYSDRIDQLLDQILNRDAFSYDPETDQLYQSYKQQYNREGNRSMQDTLASMASSAGGMNSWAATAAQQANDYYATQLTDKIPELYQLAYDMYLNDIDLQIQDLGLLQQMDDTQYNRYRDTMDDWYNDRDFAYGQYRDEMGDYQFDTSLEYEQGRDAVEDERYNKEWEYNVGRDELEDSRYTSELAYSQAMDFLSQGVMPDDELLAAAGISSTMAAAYIARLFPTATATASAGGGGGGGDGVDRIGDPIDLATWEDDGNALTMNEYLGLTGLTDALGNPQYEVDFSSINEVASKFGNGIPSEEYLADLIADGLVEAYLDEDSGKIKFAEVIAYTSDRRPANNTSSSSSSSSNKTTTTTNKQYGTGTQYADRSEADAANAAAQNSTTSNLASAQANSSLTTANTITDWLKKTFRY